VYLEARDGLGLCAPGVERHGRLARSGDEQGKDQGSPYVLWEIGW
jgi:hypothetical protein